MKADIKYQFEEVYGRESDAIFRFCLVRVSNREQALDITQETFLRLWQSLGDGKEIKNYRAFLFTVSHRLVIDWYRKKKSLSLDRMLTYNENEIAYNIPDEESSGDLSLQAEGRYLIEKIGDLSPTSQHPVYLRFVEGMSPREIGEILGISANAASVRVNRGLLELRKKTGYNEEENNEDI
jgi:RNA polymerase sigma-70 factor, ECF subfamily